VAELRRVLAVMNNINTPPQPALLFVNIETNCNFTAVGEVCGRRFGFAPGNLMS
jgi:hypothetical protein